MSLQIKLYLALAVVTAAVMIGTTAGYLWSNRRIARLEHETHEAKAAGSAAQARADDHQRRAEIYKAKTEYLEGQLAEIREIARRQDEELEKLDASVGNARRDVERARSIRSIDADVDELCRKLAELGHGCR
jgi:predicted RNase H-like nuclease (RuvC/YqgF family)